MRRVVIVGADFSPSSLPPAQRVRLFARHLPDFGWQPTVLSTAPEYYETPVDWENERLLPASLPVLRTPAWSARWTRKLGIGDLGMRSLSHHWRALSRLVREQQPDLLLIPVPPYPSMMLGPLAHARFGLPYVVDYIDPWVTDYYWRLPADQRPPKWAAAYAMARTLEPMALRRAAAVVGVSQGTVDHVLRRYDGRYSTLPTAAIPYGGEASDFEYLRANPREQSILPKEKNLRHLAYVGACIPQMRETLEALFSAVRIGLDRAPETFRALRLNFIGTRYYERGSDKSFSIASLAQAAGVESFVRESPDRIPYLDALQILLDAHGLLILGTNEPHYIASKIFPYVLSKRPLLPILHEKSSAVPILQTVQSHPVVTFSDDQPASSRVSDIAAALELVLRHAHDEEAGINGQAFEAFTARTMSQHLAVVFDHVMERKRSAQLMPRERTDRPHSAPGAELQDYR